MSFSWFLLFLSQVEIPNILKQRKQLAKLVLDYDSAKTRYISTQPDNNFFKFFFLLIVFGSNLSNVSTNMAALLK